MVAGVARPFPSVSKETDMKIRVRAVPRPNFSGFNRGGRFWPSNDWTHIEVVDQELDPLGSDGKPLPGKIGKLTLLKLRAEPNLKVEVEGETSAAAVAQAAEEVAALKAKVATLESAGVQKDNLLQSLMLMLEKERNEVELKAGAGPVDVLMRIIRERHESAVLIGQLREQAAAKAAERKGAGAAGPKGT